MTDEPEPYYLRITDGDPRNLLAGMLRCRHTANPDFADRYPRVGFWLVAVAAGRVVREVGLMEFAGATGAAVPVVLGPWGRNPGLWTTLGLTVGRGDGVEIPAAEFQAVWDHLANHLSEQGSA